jgi:hypothetical protein
MQRIRQEIYGNNCTDRQLVEPYIRENSPAHEAPGLPGGFLARDISNMTRSTAITILNAMQNSGRPWTFPEKPV